MKFLILAHLLLHFTFSTVVINIFEEQKMLQIMLAHDEYNKLKILKMEDITGTKTEKNIAPNVTSKTTHYRNIWIKVEDKINISVKDQNYGRWWQSQERPNEEPIEDFKFEDSCLVMGIFNRVILFEECGTVDKISIILPLNRRDQVIEVDYFIRLMKSYEHWIRPTVTKMDLADPNYELKVIKNELRFEKESGLFKRKLRKGRKV